MFETGSVLPTGAGVGPELSLPTSLVGAVSFCGWVELVEAGVVFSAGFDVTDSLSVPLVVASALAGWMGVGGWLSLGVGRSGLVMSGGEEVVSWLVSLPAAWSPWGTPCAAEEVMLSRVRLKGWSVSAAAVAAAAVSPAMPVAVSVVAAMVARPRRLAATSSTPDSNPLPPSPPPTAPPAAPAAAAMAAALRSWVVMSSRPPAATW
ncbi:hypothetical protein [Nocardia gamkensis]|uniref:hypothetical protein n=1 Tax=Nocardia gamkensis TaxID=352869 RepID=UPI0012F4B173|nr:hypothetical protein [Nocardia gamkensis]